MPVTTTSAALHITPVVLKTFVTHGERKAARRKGDKREDLPQDDIFYDQAFNIVKSFIRLGTQNTVESLQGFTNTHVPSPHSACVLSIMIPLSSCNISADVLLDWFGSDELRRVVGGHKWWQVRGLDGIEAEWITEKKYLSSTKERASDPKSSLSHVEEAIKRMDDIQPLMLYIHGGGYFWGSITRKIRGRVFTVNYRKAPQYPWPCAIQDVLAAYLYLVEPPVDAPHKPIPPEKITLAGDSAGAGLCLVLLTILRDLGRPMPAGAVLISPWVDLTHSFPSILHNGATDIIPEHGFISKPSTLWPPDLLPPEGGRIASTTTNPPPTPGDADTLKPSADRLDISATEQAGLRSDRPLQTQEEMLELEKSPSTAADVDDAGGLVTSGSSKSELEPLNPDNYELKPPKILMQDPQATPLELRSQIQLYATTEQLTHPLVSPVFQGSLGNLPPLYIIAGDGELIRDEIVYLAHRAAYPQHYPARDSVIRDAHRQRENVERFTQGTKVHLQLFDGMCHVPTVFTFCANARYAYRSIAAFVQHVTQLSPEELEQMPFPEPSALRIPRQSKRKGSTFSSKDSFPSKAQSATGASTPSWKQRSIREEPSPGEIGQAPGCTITMRRERVDAHGQLRPMEPTSEIHALNIPPSELGLLKEAPTMMWKAGQDEWDRRYERAARSALKKRHKLEAKADKMLQNAYSQGFKHVSQSTELSEAVQDATAIVEGEMTSKRSTAQRGISRKTSIGKIQKDRRWGPLDLEDESPPPSAIAKRRDTPEALALLKKHVYFTAPVTHLTVPKMKHADALRASLDPHDDPNRPPRQSASEQQQKVSILPVHGLRLWDKILRYFGRKSAAKAADGTEIVGDAVKDITSTVADKLE
ncbi:hypothetical protein NP233_g603 [Leucocoprinus birnbaumii]|uniref:Alpha/beta hydrolase fold-3 domain-containing protein n=1 Tax=Leucocoprinus birnbaumii TaxID=56174 RepID=A0AAD5W1I8_9AGAR|nr:hypothetical protein NP233_g603 [Leucocoprinus birnbaumii]